MNWDPLLIMLGGFLGAIARFALGHWMSAAKSVSKLPISTLFVNLSGSFVLGFIVGHDWGKTIYFMVEIGFLGAYTTFSTLNIENMQLLLRRDWKTLILYIGVTYICGILLAFLGFQLGRA